MVEEAQPADLRVSDAEREHVVELLQRAVSQGRLDVQEFSERLDASMAARTRGDLEKLLADLPGALLLDRDDLVARDFLHLRGGLRGLKRSGYWLVPPTLRVTAVRGHIDLDFSAAEFSSPVTIVELRLGLNGATLVVPEGSTVDADDARMLAGAVKDRTVKQPRRGKQHFIVRGSVKVGDLRIRYPRPARRGPITVLRENRERRTPS